MENTDIGNAFDVPTIIRGLSQDLADLRTGKITVKEAQTRADIAKQIFNGMRIMVQAQKFLSSRASEIPAINGSAEAQP
jgi:hypothetical protein